MKQQTVASLGLLLIAMVLHQSVVVSATDYAATCKELYTKIAESQVKKDQPLRPPLEWQKHKGLFPSAVHLNFVGAPEIKFMRDSLTIFDNNAFVTIWTSELLVEAASLGVVKVDEEVLVNAINAISTFKDKNFPGSGRYSFWPQELKNGTWYAHPVNLASVGADTETAGNWLRTVLTFLGLKHLWTKIAPVFTEMAKALAAFNIPADFDDSFCNIGLGALLKQNKNLFPKSHSLWQSANPSDGFGNLIEALGQYSYQPYSDTQESATIDPRSYYFMRKFIEDNANSPFRLPATWIENYKESCANVESSYSMPFNVDNVDASVVANVVFGITAQVEADPENWAAWFTSDLQSLYADSCKYIAWVITDSPLFERPDLALMYYPDIYDFLWFASRTLFAIDSLVADGYTLPPSMVTAREQLSQAVRETAVAWLHSQAQTTSDGMYWEQWLGAADTTITGKPEKNGDDRMFTTAAALNTLYDAWTEQTPAGIRWSEGVPAAVRQMTQKGAQYLNAHIHKQSLMNVFFSGSVKSVYQLPFFFPANFITLVNGSALPPDYPAGADVLATMSGVVKPEVYEQWLKEKHFGWDVPTKFPGFNVDPFPFWSSPTMTQSLSLLALSKAALLETQ